MIYNTLFKSKYKYTTFDDIWHKNVYITNIRYQYIYSVY